MKKTRIPCKRTVFSANDRSKTGPATIRRRFSISLGFTLLEVLAAMVIMGFVVTLVFGSFNIVFSGANDVNLGSDLLEMGNSALHRIKSDLEAIHVSLAPRYKPPGIDDDPEIYRIIGKEDYIGGNTFSGVRFTSLAHLPLDGDSRGGIAEIVYYGQETDTEAGTVLKRSDKLFPYPEFKEDPLDPTVCEKLRSFKLVYFDKEGNEHESWDSESDDFENSTPSAIGIQLTLGDDEIHFDFKTEINLPVKRLQETKR